MTPQQLLDREGKLSGPREDRTRLDLSYRYAKYFTFANPEAFAVALAWLNVVKVPHNVGSRSVEVPHEYEQVFLAGVAGLEVEEVGRWTSDKAP